MSQLPQLFASNMECVRSRCNKQRQYEKRLTLEYGILLAHMASLLLVESRRRVGLQKRAPSPDSRRRRTGRNGGRR